MAIGHGQARSHQRPRAKTVSTSTNAERGGVAIFTKDGIPTKRGELTHDTAILRDTERWEEATVGAEDGNKHLRVASVYG